MSTLCIAPSRSADASAARAVHADRMYFVDIGQGVVFLREIANLADRGDIAVHGIDGFEQHDLRRFPVVFLEQAFQMLKIVVAPDALRAAALAHALDHGVVVLLVREDHSALQELHQRGNRGFVRDVARGEQQGRFLAVQVCQLSFKLDVIVGRSGNIARAARAGAGRVDRLVHGGKHLGMLAHAEIIVRAPYCNRPRPLRRVMDRSRKFPLAPQNIGEYAVAPFDRQCVEGFLKLPLIVHTFSSLRDRRGPTHRADCLPAHTPELPPSAAIMARRCRKV